MKHHLVQLAHTLAAGSGLMTNALLDDSSTVAPAGTLVETHLDEASLEKMLITISSTVPPAASHTKQASSVSENGAVATFSSISASPMSGGGAKETTKGTLSAVTAVIATTDVSPSSSILEEVRFMLRRERSLI